MSATTAQKEYLASNLIWPCDVWRITARDGQVAAYASHTRDLTISGVTYKATPNEPSTSEIELGLEPDTSELLSVYDDIITKRSVEEGKWKRAAITRQIVIDYRNVSRGVTRIQKGYVGRIEPEGNYFFKIEFRSVVALLSQKIGELTSNIDRRRALAELGVNVASFTHATTVSTVTDRRKFKIPYVQPYADYLVNGLADFTSGPNAIYPPMEIKSAVTTDGGTKTEIELHLSMPSTITAGETLTVQRGYKGSLADAKLIGAAAVLNSRAEWFIPTLSYVLRYPE